MLALKLGMSLVSSNGPGGWSPTDESSLEAWYQKAEGITLNGSDVSQWADSSTKGIDMAQATAGNQPAYSAGVLTFVSTATDYLSTSGQISLTGDFTIGVKLKLISSGGVLLGDITTSNEFIRFTGTTELRMRLSGVTAVNIAKDSGTFVEDAYMVLTRVSGTLTLHWKGVAQADTETITGTALIDAIGVRSPTNNPLDSEISEIQIYSSSSAALTANVNDRLASL
jgi:hypothetical protein